MREELERGDIPRRALDETASKSRNRHVIRWQPSAKGVPKLDRFGHKVEPVVIERRGYDDPQTEDS